jgi:nudix-type nucleoside diphosphatase (YffH/AdpP family)
MSQFRKVEIHKQARIFDDFFKIDELVVAHQKFDGTMSDDQRRLVFERGDSAAVLLFNTDTKCVIVVNQFKAPTLGKGQGSGWITETLAGIVDRYETPEAAAVRETLEETGYDISKTKLKLITRFFSSPGGTSECIYLYYAEVSNDDRVGPGGGNKTEGEDITVEAIPVDELLEMVRCNRIEDPKLLIGALWVGEELKGQARRTLNHSCVKYALREHPDRFIGYVTGPIHNIRGISIWVNSENEDMIMDRFIGRSISANIRYLGAEKDPSGNLTEDVINSELTAEIGPRAPVRIGTVVRTSPGSLGRTHDVRAIFHVATVRGAGAGLGVKADIEDLTRCTKNVLTMVDEMNKRNGWLKQFKWIRDAFGLSNCESILFPMMGGGDGGLEIEHIVPRLFTAVADYYHDNPSTTLREIYFLAYTAGQKAACDREVKRLQIDTIESKPTP